MLTRFLLYGAVGCLLEVFWTGFCALLRRDYSLRATTSIWMFFIYGMAVFLEPVITVLQPFNIALRGTVYALCIFAVEYLTGGFLKRAAICPWDYTGMRFNVQGVIRLDYTPVWFALGLIFEWLFWWRVAIPV